VRTIGHAFNQATPKEMVERLLYVLVPPS